MILSGTVASPASCFRLLPDKQNHYRSYSKAKFYPSLSRKHGLATFVYKRLRYTLLDQSSPTSEIEWLCVDVDGYKIVNVYKPPPTRLRTLDLPVFPHPCLYAGDFNCRHADWSYDGNNSDGECLAGWASINCLALLYVLCQGRCQFLFRPLEHWHQSRSSFR